MFAQQSTKDSPEKLFVDDLGESPAWENREERIVPTREEPKGFLARGRDHEWIIGLLYAACDIACWVLLYGFVGYVRHAAGRYGELAPLGRLLDEVEGKRAQARYTF